MILAGHARQSTIMTYPRHACLSATKPSKGQAKPSYPDPEMAKIENLPSPSWPQGSD